MTNSFSTFKDRALERNQANEVNFIIKFFWLCSGANIEVIKKAKADQGRYASIGFSIVLISLLAGISGGFALYTVFEELLISSFGGVLWGIVLGTMDRFVVSSVRKSEEASIKEKFGGTVFFLLRLGISVLISFVVAKPLELKIFEPSIENKINQEKIEKIDIAIQNIETEYENKIKNKEIEKENINQQYQSELNQLNTERIDARNQVNNELLVGSKDRRSGVGIVSNKLEQREKEANQRYKDKNQQLQIEIDKIDVNISNLEAEKKRKLSDKKIEIENKKINTDFVTQLTLLHEIQKEEEKFIIFSKEKLVFPISQ